MSLKSKITDIARREAQEVVRNQTAILNNQTANCSIMGRVTKSEVKNGFIILSVLLPDGSTITANASGSTRAVGPGSTVLVINGYVIL